jgi:hypothetical protein
MTESLTEAELMERERRWLYELEHPPISCPEEARDRRAAIEYGEAIAEMVATKGWHMLRSHFDRVHQAFMAELVEATDMDRIRRLQSDITAIGNLFDYADRAIKAMAIARAAKPEGD